VAVKRTGSYVSDKKMARAAVENQLLRFRLTSGHEVRGYLSGMDSYNWMVVTKDGGNFIIHKTNVELLEITDIFLFQESPEAIANVTQIAKSFWAFCEKEYFGKGEVDG